MDAYQESLAQILLTSGWLKANRLHDLPGQLTLLHRALEIREKLARDHPEVARYQMDLGVALATAGENLALSRRLADAEVAVGRSKVILEKLAADHPQDGRIIHALCQAYWQMRQTAFFRGDSQSAAEWSGREIELYRSLARRDPRNRYVGLRELWCALGERGEAWTRLGRLVEALADFREVIELAHENGDRDEELFRLFHALTKARLGDLSELTQLGDRGPDTVEAGTGQGGSTIYTYWIFNYDAACGVRGPGPTGAPGSAAAASRAPGAGRSEPEAVPRVSRQGAISRRVRGDGSPRRAPAGGPAGPAPFASQVPGPALGSRVPRKCVPTQMTTIVLRVPF